MNRQKLAPSFLQPVELSLLAMRLSIVIPVYNERATIIELLDRVAAVDLDTEVIVVDDGSTDGTRELLRERAAREGDGMTLLLQPTNQGQGAALRAGGGGWRACPLWLAYAGPSTSTSLHSAQNEWAGALRWRRLAWPGPSTALHSAVLRSASLRPFDAAQDARRGAAPLKIPVGGGLAHLGWSTLGPHPSPPTVWRGFMRGDSPNLRALVGGQKNLLGSGKMKMPCGHHGCP